MQSSEFANLALIIHYSSILESEIGDDDVPPPPPADLSAIK